MKVNVIAFSNNGCRTAGKVADALPGEEVRLFAKTKADTEGIRGAETSLRSWTEEAFGTCDAIVFVGAAGIAVREIAPFVRSKDTDPAVICIDELARFCIPLLSGHIGGANALAAKIAGALGAVPVVTTATDLNGKISIDAFAATHDLFITDLKPAKEVSSRILGGLPVGLISDFPVAGDIPEGLVCGAGAPVGVYIGERDIEPFGTTLRLIPRRYTLGIGCRKDVSAGEIAEKVDLALDKAGITMRSVRAMASIDLKKDEKGLSEFAAANRLPIGYYTSAELNGVPGEFSCSGFVKSVTDVDCVCERAALKVSRNGRLKLRKFAGGGVTVAVAEEDFTVDFTGSGTR